jgi:serralysin
VATQDNSVPGSGYGNAYIDSLIWGCKWSGGPVTYWFGSGYEASEGFTCAAWSDDAKDAFEGALANYAAVCGLTFAEAGSKNSANIVWWQAPFSSAGEPNLLGMHDVPDGTYAQEYGYFNYQNESWDYLQPGQYGYVTVIHELGHGMGLAHPHDGGGEASATKFPGVSGAFGSYGTYGLNQGIWTTMSYNDGWNLAPSNYYEYGNQASLMALDIAALQTLYGKNMSYHSGDDLYQLVLANDAADGSGWSCIWDGGGADTISAAGAGVGVAINLQAATLVGAYAGGYVSRAGSVLGGYTIANGVVIENAVGGDANDLLVGNAAANVLDGGAGIDKLSGGLGDDTYVVDAAGDVIVELSGQGNDSVRAGVSYTLGAYLENLTLEGGAANGTGNALANVVTGNDGDNVLDGKGGADTLIGADGDDRYLVDSLYDTVVELGGEGADTVQSVVSFSLAGLANVENLTLAGSGAINGSGNAGANILIGNTGANKLYGGAGDDTITPGNGTDFVQGGLGNDNIDLSETRIARDSLQYAQSGAANVDVVGAFLVRSDCVMLSVGDFGGAQLANTAGVDLAAALSVGAFTQLALLADQSVPYTTMTAKNLLILSSLTADSYAAAIGAGALGIASDAALGAGKALAAAYYDSVHAQAVIGFIENSDTGAANAITGADNFVEVVRIGMAPLAYTAVNLDGSIGAWLG